MTGYVATIGMFDGVHRGHQFVLQQVVETARACGLQPMAITFERNEQQTLTPMGAKRLLLTKMGIERIEVLPFTDELRLMTARQFMQQVLRDELGVKILLTGYDNRFGHNRTEGFDDYVRYGKELGIDVRQLPPITPPLSSSLIRQLLTEGRVSEAAEALGYNYTIEGRVEHGEHVGTKLGFPTANIELVNEHQLIPAAGVYAVKVRIPHSMEDKHAMMNIGHRPTFDGQRQTLEVHILQLHENLYGQELLVSFVKRLRDEQRFDSIEALKSQLQQDKQAAEEAMEED